MGNKEHDILTMTIWRRLLLGLPAIILVGFALIVSLMQTPIVQTKVTNVITEFVSNNTDYTIDIGYVNLMWYDNILFENIRVYDQEDSTLLKTSDLSVNLSLIDLFLNEGIMIDEIVLNDPFFHLIKKTDSTAINVSDFIGQLSGNEPKVKNENPTDIGIGSIKVFNGKFTYNDMTKPRLDKGKDHNHFGYRSIYTQVDDFLKHKDSIDFKFIYLQAIGLNERLNIRSLNGLFSYCNQSMTLSKLDLRTDYSLLKDSLRFNYGSPEGLKHFMDSVSFYVNLDSSYISSKDIALFAPALKGLNEKYEITGQVKGTVGNLMVKNLDLRFGRRTFIDGNLHFFGLPKIKETFIDINFNRSVLAPTDLAKYIPDRYHQKLYNAGIIRFKGQYLGFPTDFVSNGTFDMKVGHVKSDINFKLDEENHASYSGNLTLTNFDLGAILDKEDIIQKIDLNGHVRGEGLELHNANVHLNADIDTIGIRGYNYSRIHANGDLTNEYFEGELQTNDPNLVFDGIVSIDARNRADKVKLNASLEKLHLKNLGLSEQDISISSNIDIDMKGFHVDSLKGFANLRNSKLQINKDKLELDSVNFLSFIVGDERVISLETDGLSAQAKGDFKNSTVLRELKKLYNELYLNIQNNTDSLESYYARKDDQTEKFEIDLKMNLWNLNKFTTPFFADWNFSKNITIEGSFISNKTSILTLNSHVDSIQVGPNTWMDNLIDVNISKRKNSKNILSSFFLSSNEQNWNDKSSTNDIYFESIWSNNHMDLEFNVEQPELKNNLDVKATVDFLKDSIDIHIQPSNIRAFDKIWRFDPSNLITLIDNKMIFSNLGLSFDDQKLAVNGTLSNDVKDQVQIDIRNFSLNSLNTLLPVNLTGIVDGNIEINKLHDNVLIESNIKAESLHIEDFLLGDLDCFSDWENEKQRLYLEFSVDRADKRIIDIGGHFYPQSESDQLDMSAKFDNANLNIIQPFLVENFSDLRGYASGEFSISGNPSAPILDSKGKPGTITDGNITIKYTHSTYAFSGGIIFDENHIGVENLELIDKQMNKAVFKGGIFHDSFQHFVLDITGNYDNFQLLNTGSKDNKLYYGTAFATGDINILGAVNNLNVTAHAKTNKGTRISIPVGELSEYNVDQKEYISFIDLNNPEHQKSIEEIAEEEIDLKGLKLDFDIEVTNDAYTELIFDAKAGDIIRGRGNGNIELQIDPFGDFNMFGDLQIESGGYNFTLYNIINKEFDILKGSSISWYGDPYRARMNINARYRQLASLAPIFSDASIDINAPEARTKYPSIVNLYLKGELLSPEISFDIDIEDYPDNISGPNFSIPLDAEINAFKARLAADEQEMKRQVFSLVILRKFSPENSFSVNSQTIGNSLSEFVSNQLSYWATQVDENLEVDVNLAGLNQEAFNTFQLRLSYSFLDGRLKVTRGGGFSDANNNSDISSIIGDWTVEYLLTADGRFRAKMYSRSNINTATTNNIGQNNTETGFSLQYIRSFDELKEILSESRKENQKKQKEEVIEGNANAIRDDEDELLSTK